jgi:RNA polymerase sigma factor (sigma-70 family)
MATMRAVRKFNLNSGVYLMTYAYRAVQYAMLRLLTSRDRKLKTCSLDRVLSGTDGLTLATSAPGKEEIEAEVERREWIVMVHAAIGTLSQRDRDIVTRRMYGETLREIGDAWGISKERVRQLEKHALKVVRKQLVGPKMERVML